MARNPLGWQPMLTLSLLGLLVNPQLALAQEKSAAAPKFNQDVRPILSSACYRCHGFDAKTREAELRLDIEDGAFPKRA